MRETKGDEGDEGQEGDERRRGTRGTEGDARGRRGRRGTGGDARRVSAIETVCHAGGASAAAAVCVGGGQGALQEAERRRFSHLAAAGGEQLSDRQAAFRVLPLPQAEDQGVVVFEVVEQRSLGPGERGLERPPLLGHLALHIAWRTAGCGDVRSGSASFFVVVDVCVVCRSRSQSGGRIAPPCVCGCCAHRPQALRTPSSSSWSSSCR